VFLAGLGLGYLLWGKSGGSIPTATISTSSASTPISPQQSKRYNIPADGSPALGPANAPITMVEFSDYQCPYCRQWHDQVYNRLLQDYKGKIRFVYRDFPLSGIHPSAISAAESAYCAGEQGSYWQYHDLLFTGQYDLGVAGYQKYAAILKLDLTKFNACLTKRTYQAEVETNYDFAANLGIQSTPTFFINGLAVVGAQPYDYFKQVIDMEIAGKIPK
jgi:protein-disulfide isomerase